MELLERHLVANEWHESPKNLFRIIHVCINLAELGNIRINPVQRGLLGRVMESLDSPGIIGHSGRGTKERLRKFLTR